MDSILFQVSDVFDKIINDFTDIEELRKWASSYGLLQDKLVIQKIKELSLLSFKCSLCSKEYKYKHNLVRHVKTIHDESSDVYPCSLCKKAFKRSDVLQRHQRSCIVKSNLEDKKSEEYECECGKAYRYKHHLKRHKQKCTAKWNCSICGQLVEINSIQEHEKNCKIRRKEKNYKIKVTPNEPVQNHSVHVRCRKCRQMFPNRKELYRHQMAEHMSGKGSYPWSQGEEPWIDASGEVDEKLKETYDLNFPLISEFTQSRELSACYNFPISHDFQVSDILDLANNIYNKQKHAFRLNVIFGYILRNIESGEYRYFKPYENEEIFDFPIYISKRTDLDKFERKLNDIDVCTYILRQRPNTKWRIQLVTNVKFLVYFSRFALGAPTQLPSYITKKNNAIVSFEKDPKHSRFYNDNLCLFRCLAFHKLKSNTANGFEQEVKRSFNVWNNFLFENEFIRSNEWYVENFDGVHLDEIRHFEICFNINIDIFEINENGSSKVIYKSLCAYENHMYLNIYENHLSYITNIKRYCRKYVCHICDKHFVTAKKVNRHFKDCSNKTKHIFPGGFYSLKKTIFEELKEIDIIVPENDELFPWFIVFDMEAMLEKIDSSSNSKLTFERLHRPISVSICSNVPGFEKEKFFLNRNLDILLQGMIDFMHQISSKVFELAKVKWSGVFRKLEKLKEIWTPQFDGEEEEDNDTDKMETDEFEPPSKEFLKKLKLKNVFQNFVENLETDKWEVQYNDHESDHECDSKDDEDTSSESYLNDNKENAYANNKIKKVMLNLINKLEEKFISYCAQVPVLGFNSSKYDLNLIKTKLAKVLNMHNTKHSFTIKKNNAYNCLSSPFLRFLDMTQFLAAGTSYSKFLKAYNVDEAKGFFPYEWFDNYDKLDYPGIPPLGDAWFSSLKQKCVLDDGLRSEVENYRYLENVWIEKGMKTFKDFLEWYNNLDVKPFVKGISNYLKHYWEKKIDVFKIAFSVPGIARLNLFRCSQNDNSVFPLFDRNTKEFYYKIQDNIVGGPSIIFTRYHKVNKTYIRENPEKVCKRIVGYDANALYLSCIGQPMPVGYLVIRRRENQFKAEVRDKFWSMYNWMDWLSEGKKNKIMHKLNAGREKRVGPFPVDGFDPYTNTIYQFNGCYYHGHSCQLSKSLNSNEREKRYTRTQECERYLKYIGYKIISIWECQYLKLKSTNKSLQDIVDRNVPSFYKKHKKCVTMSQIIRAIKKDDIFGIVECDISVPEHWDPKMPKFTDLSPAEYFKEMSPLFCTTEVPFDSIGEHMQSYAKEVGISDKSRKLLVGGNKASNIMLSTPLLKWYLDHGLQVTKVYTVIESCSRKCFSKFTEDVSAARRRGDNDPTQEVISDTVKVEGNSAYGSLLLNKDKFTRVEYVDGKAEASKKINEKTFIKLDELDSNESFYELQMAPKTIVHDLPIQLGFFILQYAKLRILQFYYDFLDQFIDRSDFELMEMDTDSAYFAISSDDIDNLIKLPLLNTYKDQLYNNCSNQNQSNMWFPRRCCEQHKVYDKRTPGLFKLEFDGDEMIGLCSKTYAISKIDIVKIHKTKTSRNIAANQILQKYIYKKLKFSRALSIKKISKRFYVGQLQRRVKFSSKGISKRSIKNHVATYKSVLDTRRSVDGLNKGLLVRKNKMYSYSQARKGLTYFYCKRKVLSDGIHTEPLDLTLVPCKKANNQTK